MLGEVKSNSSLVARTRAKREKMATAPRELLALPEHQVRNGIARQTSLQVHAAVEDVVMLADRLHFAALYASCNLAQSSAEALQQSFPLQLKKKDSQNVVGTCYGGPQRLGLVCGLCRRRLAT